jgi:hypothetical protein
MEIYMRMMLFVVKSIFINCKQNQHNKTTTSIMSNTKTVFKKVIVGCDHAAFEMKNKVVQHLKDKYQDVIEIFDAGVYTPERMDYPQIAKTVCTKIQQKEYGKSTPLYPLT